MTADVKTVLKLLAKEGLHEELFPRDLDLQVITKVANLVSIVKAVGVYRALEREYVRTAHFGELEVV